MLTIICIMRIMGIAPICRSPVIGISPEDPGIDPVGIRCAAGVPFAASDDVLVWARTALAEAVRNAATKRAFREDMEHSLPI
jgi:hypothetical protein